MPTMNYQQFLNKIQKKGSKPHRIAHCLGVRDAWKWMRKNKWKYLNPCPQTLYHTIISTVNKHITDILIEGHSVHLPYGMGSIELHSSSPKLERKNGEWKTNYRTDWPKTLKLWYSDEEAMLNHYHVKKQEKIIYYIRYMKTNANYHNKRYYKMRFNRSLIKKLGAALERGRVSAEHKS